MNTTINEEFIKSLEWRAFEFLCYSIFKYLGKWDVELNNGGADKGADILLKAKNSRKILAIIQCKAYSKEKIKVRFVRELLGAMSEHKAQKGIFLTTSSYTQSAIEMAKKMNIVPYSTKDILSLLQRLPESKQQDIFDTINATDYTTPTCVNCGIKMVKRVAQKGPYVGKSFWGCPNFPRCNFRLHMSPNHEQDSDISGIIEPSTSDSLHLKKEKKIHVSPDHEQDSNTSEIRKPSLNNSSQQKNNNKKQKVSVFEFLQHLMSTVGLSRMVKFKLIASSVVTLSVILAFLLVFNSITNTLQTPTVTNSKDGIHTKLEPILIREPESNPTEEDLIFSDEQIETAMREVFDPKKDQNNNSSNANTDDIQPKYQYEIELFSGGKIYTDNAEIIENNIRYKSKNGMIISINKEEIKRMKKVKTY